eukprot:357053-Pyramimonas_sp.AAC.1
MGAHQNSSGPNTAVLPKVIGASSAALVEIGFFHPVDTVAKRLMSNTDGTRTIGEVVFKKAHEKPLGARI